LLDFLAIRADVSAQRLPNRRPPDLPYFLLYVIDLIGFTSSTSTKKNELFTKTQFTNNEGAFHDST
jgi:hypothetical protein